MYGLSFLEENYSHQNAKKITTTHQLLGDVHHLVEVLNGLQLKMSVLQWVKDSSLHLLQTRSKMLTFAHFCLLFPEATLTLTCSCGNNPGSIWSGRGLALIRTIAVTRLRLLPPLMRTCPAGRSSCPTPWRNWVVPLPPPPPPHHRPAPPRLSLPSRTRILLVNIATRSHGLITQQWSRG